MVWVNSGFQSVVSGPQTSLSKDWLEMQILRLHTWPTDASLGLGPAICVLTSAPTDADVP